jgi:phosphoenolpyruvate synthase/pyruvate phosphate dikinase
MWVRALADASAEAGGKAGGLARAIAAGLRVPDGFVVETGAFAAIAQLGGTLAGVGHDLGAVAARIRDAELPSDLVHEVEARAAVLGVVSVRSSAAIEDRTTGAAPGVFSVKRQISDLESLLGSEETRASGIATALQSVEEELRAADDTRIIAEERARTAEQELTAR